MSGPTDHTHNIGSRKHPHSKVLYSSPASSRCFLGVGSPPRLAVGHGSSIVGFVYPPPHAGAVAAASVISFGSGIRRSSCLDTCRRLRVRPWSGDSACSAQATKSVRNLRLLACPTSPHRRVTRSRNSLRARNSLDFAAGTVIPKRSATSIMGSPSRSRSSITRLRSGGVRRISICKISCISR
jgi:hypothetical protein